jgi:hypothetical protein
MTQIPQAARLKQLTMAGQYAAVELFRGTMMRHSLVVYRADNADAQTLSFDGEGWLAYVPIRVPETICVRDRPPPGAAAVLINRTHAYRDLFLPITPAEMRMFDSIDGERTIAAIADKRAAARTFFERLWWYDQVVFDAARAASAPIAIASSTCAAADR